MVCSETSRVSADTSPSLSPALFSVLSRASLSSRLKLVPQVRLFHPVNLPEALWSTFHGFGNHVPLAAAAVTISADLVLALEGFEDLFSPSPSCSFTLLSSLGWQPTVALALKKSCLLPWLLALERGKNLPAPTSSHSIPFPVLSNPWGCSRCQSPGIQPGMSSQPAFVNMAEINPLLN